MEIAADRERERELGLRLGAATSHETTSGETEQMMTGAARPEEADEH